MRTPANSMPFNSVDLSLPSSSAAPPPPPPPTAHANRNSLTPSPRTQISPVSASSSSNHRFSKHHSDNEDCSTNNGANKMDNTKLNTDPIAFLNEMSEQLASIRSNRNLSASANFARDSNSDLSDIRNNGGNDKVESFIIKN